MVDNDSNISNSKRESEIERECERKGKSESESESDERENDSENEGGMKKNATKITVFEKMMLSDFIFQNLQEFLSYPYTELNNSLTVSRNFRDLKRSIFYWKLNKEYSLKYFMDTNYRIRLDLLIANSKTQLSLDLSRFSEITNVSTLGNVHELNLSECANLTDVSALGSVHALDLSSCVRIRDIR
jgi:hypothetical protein